MHEFLKFIFRIELYMSRTGFLSSIRRLVLYTQQLYVKTCMTYTYCCVPSARLLMMDRKPVRDM
jgi:hypothetical protein